MGKTLFWFTLLCIGAILRQEFNSVIKGIVDTRLALDELTHTLLDEMRRGISPQYRGHYWGKEHLDALECVRQGTEAAWHYAKWLQWPEAQHRLEEGERALLAVGNSDMPLESTSLELFATLRARTRIGCRCTQIGHHKLY